MRVLCDLHHNALFHSMQLMGKRIGFEVLRPIGMEWFHEGFFGIAEPYGNSLDTVKQFLEIADQPIVNNAPALNNGHTALGPGIYVCADHTNESFNYAITLETFKNVQFDAIIATIPYHWQKYKDLRDKYQPKAKLIAQFGNLGWQIPADYPNILDSTGSYNCPDRNYIPYHQEFNENVFKPDLNVIPNNHIRSFNLDFNESARLEQLRNYCSAYKFEIYSTSPCADYAPITGISKLARKMQESLLGLQLKFSDGYGHLVHNWAACGVPLLINADYQTGVFAQRLFIEGETCMKLTGDIISDMSKINIAASPDVNHKMRETMRRIYKSEVDFNYEATLLKKFWTNLR